ncbi:PepSY domain-containing protein [Roseibium sp. FZY0029]|uniref:PepSY domain-containing protein n=1 Tax=Roseibium sp. FZY0029 TaxID=3116647 RepID=UPI002EC4CB81|nr:PepSY domain-containing protein [Roseibium sp. FZY0029]
MLRILHTWPTLLAGVLVTVMAMSGAVLSLEPAVARFSQPVGQTVAEDTTVASLASGVVAHFSDPQKIVRRASGQVVVYHADADGFAADLVDPATGESLGAYQPSAFFQTVTELHRSLFAGETGRIATGIGAAVMILLSVGGVLLLVTRSGGWRKLLKPSSGTFAQRLHVEAGRIAVAGLGILAVTGLFMSLTSFRLIGAPAEDSFLSFAESSAGPALAVADMPALQNVDIADLRELVFPAKGDALDVFGLTVAQGSGFIDQATGNFLSFSANTLAESLYQLAYTLHTGQGAWGYALVLGIAGLSVPVLFVSGMATWVRRVRRSVRIAGNVPAGRADTVILVGSEGNSTWGFARSLHAALKAQGLVVHTASMNDLAGSYPSARRLIVLAATYGDGDAPASASRFMSRLAGFNSQTDLAVSVVGFGDRSFPAFCAYARQVEGALKDMGVAELLPMATVDRQSTQQFAAWSHDLGKAIGIDLHVEHTADLPDLKEWECVARKDFGQAYQTPKSILRFRAVQTKPGKFSLSRAAGPSFKAGDLIGVLPKGSDVPRFYSLASSASDGFLEIAVSKHPGGLCSGQLCDLGPGDRIAGFIQPNARFNMPRGKAPVILIGAGTGVAPLVGMVRANDALKPAYLFAGSRDPQSDQLYREEIDTFRKSGRVRNVSYSFSRVPGGAYVQDALRANAEELRRMVRQGADIMICGGTSMAEGVSKALDDVLGPLGLTVQKLRADGRYQEDVY